MSRERDQNKESPEGFISDEILSAEEQKWVSLLDSRFGEWITLDDLSHLGVDFDALGLIYAFERKTSLNPSSEIDKNKFSHSIKLTHRCSKIEVGQFFMDITDTHDSKDCGDFCHEKHSPDKGCIFSSACLKRADNKKCLHKWDTEDSAADACFWKSPRGKIAGYSWLAEKIGLDESLETFLDGAADKMQDDLSGLDSSIRKAYVNDYINEMYEDFAEYPSWVQPLLIRINRRRSNFFTEFERLSTQKKRDLFFDLFRLRYGAEIKKKVNLLLMKLS